ncbi:MAG: DNA replication/repair protein RecF [Thermoleophilia bacterium]
MSGATRDDAHVVRRLEVSDLRAWHRGALDLPAGLVVITGPNGAGKTSLIEAIVFGCLGVSPRTSREGELVRAGAEAAHVRLVLDGPAGTVEREIGFSPGRGRRLRLDGVPVRSLAEWRARVVLVFLPEELRAVKGPPAARRRALDRVLEAAEPGYAVALADYQRAMAQRNALLRRIRSGEADEAAIGVWEETMAGRGALVARVRGAGVEALAPGFARWLEELGGGPEGELRLEPSPDDRPEGGDDAVALALKEMWRARRPREIQAAQTLSGPHRDDLWIGAGGADLRRVGSQGEQRTAALALLLAARDHLRARGPRPILLLDDVLSELDPERRRRLLDAVRDGGQTIVTSADPAVTEGLSAPPDAVLRVRGGAHVG